MGLVLDNRQLLMCYKTKPNPLCEEEKPRKNINQTSRILDCVKIID